ncbi:receptor-type tyrosine-protein phosphatase eta-like isoform X2 [Neocloeon triangulifer]|uniref:receptor-type tyrosine-protein phosphatase eta-like isoform X2 n=1 Tax=Neocloeon triangulifer TaxID=2078957 RepID=UPI00286EFEB3|nr:receptor-type tyrosine-protein phosphatase eta-like isoform X2 [Neocloeon triangulifer]
MKSSRARILALTALAFLVFIIPAAHSTGKQDQSGGNGNKALPTFTEPSSKYTTESTRNDSLQTTSVQSDESLTSVPHYSGTTKISLSNGITTADPSQKASSSFEPSSSTSENENESNNITGLTASEVPSTSSALSSSTTETGSQSTTITDAPQQSNTNARVSSETVSALTQLADNFTSMTSETLADFSSAIESSPENEISSTQRNKALPTFTEPSSKYTTESTRNDSLQTTSVQSDARVSSETVSALTQLADNFTSMTSETLADFSSAIESSPENEISSTQRNKALPTFTEPSSKYTTESTRNDSLQTTSVQSDARVSSETVSALTQLADNFTSMTSETLADFSSAIESSPENEISSTQRNKALPTFTEPSSKYTTESTRNDSLQTTSVQSDARVSSETVSALTQLADNFTSMTSETLADFSSAIESSPENEISSTQSFNFEITSSTELTPSADVSSSFSALSSSSANTGSQSVDQQDENNFTSSENPSEGKSEGTTSLNTESSMIASSISESQSTTSLSTSISDKMEKRDAEAQTDEKNSTNNTTAKTTTFRSDYDNQASATSPKPTTTSTTSQNTTKLSSSITSSNTMSTFTTQKTPSSTTTSVPKIMLNNITVIEDQATLEFISDVACNDVQLICLRNDTCCKNGSCEQGNSNKSVMFGGLTSNSGYEIFVNSTKIDKTVHTEVVDVPPVRNLNKTKDFWGIYLTWDEPCSNTPNQNFSYKVNVSYCGSNYLTNVTTKKAFNIHDLIDGCNYTISVTALLGNKEINQSKATHIGVELKPLENKLIKINNSTDVVNISWSVDANYTEVEAYCMDCKGGNCTSDFKAKVSTRYIDLKELYPGKSYDYNIKFHKLELTRTVNGTFTTKVEVAGPMHLAFDNETNKLTWKAPNLKCYTIKDYMVQFNLTTKSTNNQTEFRVTNENLKNNQSVTVKVFAIDSNDDKGEESSLYITKLDDIPSPPSGEVEASLGDERRSKQVAIQWPKNLFGESKITRWAILVARHNNDAAQGNYIGQGEEVITWAQHMKNNGDPRFYRPTKEEWNMDNTVSNFRYHVGADDSCNPDDLTVFCNGPLKPKTKYYFKIRGFTTVGFRDTALKSLETDEETSNAGIYILALVSLIFIGTILFGIWFNRRENPRCVQKIMFRMGAIRRGIQQQRETIIEMQERRPLISKSVPKSEFAKYLEKLLDEAEHEEGNELSEQFKQLAMLSPPPPSTHPENYSAAMLQYNKRKNRYINILPYDSTRVVLSVVSPNDPESDYINASEVKGFSGQIEYVACQGPLADTAEDFWRMVFEKDVCVIVMVTNLEEKGKIKCHKYFPDLRETIRYERVAVKCILQADFPVYTRRTFLVQETDGIILKTVIQLHFKEWPDFGCPETTDLLLSFCRTVRELANANLDGLVLVHCSAGVGRTGTLIALDMLLQEIRANREINIFDKILQLRYQRINMVQTEGQYKYIHECVRDAIEEDMKDGLNMNGGGGRVSAHLDPIYQNLKKDLKDRPTSVLTEIQNLEEISSENEEIESSQEELAPATVIKVRHSVNMELDNEVTEVVIPITETEAEDTQRTTDDNNL